MVAQEEPRVLSAVIILIASIVLSIAVVAVTALVLLLEGTASSRDIFTVIIALAIPIFDVSLLATTLPYIIRKGLVGILGLAIGANLIILGLLWGAGIFAVNLAISYIMTQFLGKYYYSGIYEYFISYPLTKYVLIASAILLAPVAEELYFRGVLYTSLKAKLGVWGGAVLSAVVFAAIHGMPAAFITLLVIGIMLAYVFEKYKSLTPAIVAHLINNSLSVVILLTSYH